VDTVHIGNLTHVLDTHWSGETDATIHEFPTLGKFINRLVCTAEEYGISVELRSGAWTTRVPAVWRHRPDDTESGHAHLPVWMQAVR
jgi:hypothetical protein